jgi:hypothetical protein
MTPNKRGAPLGNKNALKHGIYSRAFTKEEQREWLSPAKGGLQPEINLFKILIARTARMLKPLDEDSAPSFHESVAALYVVSMVVSRLNSFYCTNEKFYAANDASLVEFYTNLGFTQEQIEIELYGPPEKTRGGQLGNTNALKYGFYASVFEPGEIRNLEKITKAELYDEVALLRVLIKRTVISMNDLSNLDIMDYLRGIRVITFAGACVEKLERTRKLVFDEPVTTEKLLIQATAKMDAELKAKGLGGIDPREPLNPARKSDA